jgi:hypothetical protein
MENLHKKSCHVFVHCLPSRMLHSSPVWSLLLNQYDGTSWISNVVALPKHKLAKLAALSCNVGGDRFAFAVDVSNILTDVLHVYSRPNPENSGVNTPLSNHDRFFPYPTQFFIGCYPALYTSNFVYLTVRVTIFSDSLAWRQTSQYSPLFRFDIFQSPSVYV